MKFCFMVLLAAKKLVRNHIEMVIYSSYCNFDSECITVRDVYCKASFNVKNLDKVKTSQKILLKNGCEIPISCTIFVNQSAVCFHHTCTG